MPLNKETKPNQKMYHNFHNKLYPILLLESCESEYARIRHADQ